MKRIISSYILSQHLTSYSLFITMPLRNVVILVLLSINFVRAMNEDYIGAVVEYNVKYSNKYNSYQNVIENALMHRNIIRDVFSAGLKPDIVVFPENGLKCIPATKPAISTILPSAADNITPCRGESGYTNSTILLEILSCTAQMYDVYMVVNLLEKHNENGKDYYYNTNVAFNRKGTIVARYRKHNLYSRESTSDGVVLNKPSSPEFSYFDTDFGVRFGMFTCFDIVFKTPALDLVKEYNISHFVFPTHWFSEMPFLTAIQAQYSWAASNNVVLLASGVNYPDTGSSGSGIYIGANNSPTSYVQTHSSSDIVIVRKIPKHIISQQINDPGEVIYNRNNGSTKLFMKIDREIHSFRSELINEKDTLDCDSSTCKSSQSADLKTICHGDFCCRFSYNLDTFYHEKNEVDFYLRNGDDFGFNYYRMVVYDGVKDYDGVAKGHVQVCAVLSCIDENIDSCGIPTYNGQKLTRHFNGKTYIKSRSKFINLEISANFSDNATSIMPNVLYSRSSNNSQSFGSLGTKNSFLFYRNHFPKERIMQAVIKANQSRESSSENIGVFGIYTRVFDAPPNKAAGMFSSNIAILSIVTFFVLKYSIFLIF